MITYTWEVSQLERDVSDDYVHTVHWRCTAVDGEYSASNYGTCGFNRAEKAQATPFANLAEKAVLGWVYGSVGKADVEAALAAKLDKLMNPTSVSGIPW